MKIGCSFASPFRDDKIISQILILVFDWKFLENQKEKGICFKENLQKDVSSFFHKYCKRQTTNATFTYLV